VFTDCGWSGDRAVPNAAVTELRHVGLPDDHGVRRFDPLDHDVSSSGQSLVAGEPWPSDALGGDQVLHAIGTPASGPRTRRDDGVGNAPAAFERAPGGLAKRRAVVPPGAPSRRTASVTSTGESLFHYPCCQLGRRHAQMSSRRRVSRGPPAVTCVDCYAGGRPANLDTPRVAISGCELFAREVRGDDTSAGARRSPSSSAAYAAPALADQRRPPHRPARCSGRCGYHRATPRR